MTESLTAPAVTPYPADPADLFVTLYDELPESVFRSWDIMDWFDDQDVKQLSHLISEAVLDYGELAPEDVGRIVEDQGDRGRFTILLGLDEALWYVNPYAGGSMTEAFSPLYELAVRYQKTFRYNTTETPGALLPGCAFPCRPIAKREKDEFFSLRRMTPEHMKIVKHRVLPPVEDAYFSPERPVKVGCAPLLETYDDVAFTFGRRGGVATYKLGPAASPALYNRIKRVLWNLDESGAQIAVMPEATLNDEILDYWRHAAFDTAERRRDTSPLRYLLFGTGPLGDGDPPPNRAVLIDRWTGKDVLVQDKILGFALSDHHLKNWRIPRPPKKGPVEEYTERGAVIGSVDTGLGRLSILICEDFSRPGKWEENLRAAGVSHLLVPIFSKPIYRYRWERDAAEHRLTALGSWVVVSNSLVVGHHRTPDKSEGEPYTCLVAGPHEDDVLRETYDIKLQFGSAATGDELGMVTVEKDDGTTTRELPYVMPAVVRQEWYRRSHPE
ncbi:hypothetical protein J4573_01260 [Actinomadura barringtoniae]|uniref:CN hydrolase domain-containing protein n=1 Tax=Actinomadura barringtoniae TaxID=1427535 RepID=A0A939P9Z2_9ACTN|nr:hypothetical protein [Actinomadura barringtoniae]MBO2445709.1 hypothetical protein [Actinomadura barringtoniae]